MKYLMILVILGVVLVFGSYFILTYPVGYQEAVVVINGEKQKVYYYVYFEETEISFQGSRNITRKYRLKDEATYRSSFYIHTRKFMTLGRIDFYAAPENFHEVAPGSFLQKIVLNNSSSEGGVIFEEIVRQVEIQRSLEKTSLEE